jgi:Carboxypeptidase regulatory-like domain
MKVNLMRGNNQRTLAYVCCSLLAFALSTSVPPTSYPSKENENQRTDERKTGVVSGVVKDDEGKLLEKAKVEIRAKSKTTYTKADGAYKFTDLEAERECRLDMTKHLYQDNGTSVEVEADKDNKASDVTLKYKGPNVDSIRSLRDFIKENKLTEFERQLRSLLVDCDGVVKQDCNELRQVKRLFDDKNYGAITLVLERIIRDKTR